MAPNIMQKNSTVTATFDEKMCTSSSPTSMLGRFPMTPNGSEVERRAPLTYSSETSGRATRTSARTNG